MGAPFLRLGALGNWGAGVAAAEVPGGPKVGCRRPAYGSRGVGAGGTGANPLPGCWMAQSWGDKKRTRFRNRVLEATVEEWVLADLLILIAGLEELFEAADAASVEL